MSDRESPLSTEIYSHARTNQIQKYPSHFEIAWKQWNPSLGYHAIQQNAPTKHKPPELPQNYTKTTPELCALHLQAPRLFPVDLDPEKSTIQNKHLEQAMDLPSSLHQEGGCLFNLFFFSLGRVWFTLARFFYSYQGIFFYFFFLLFSFTLWGGDWMVSYWVLCTQFLMILEDFPFWGENHCRSICKLTDVCLLTSVIVMLCFVGVGTTSENNPLLNNTQGLPRP